MRRYAWLLVVCLPVVAAGDGEMDRLQGQMQALAQRSAMLEKELAELKAQQAALAAELEKGKGAPAAAPSGETKSWLAERVRVGGYGSVRFEGNDVAGAAKGFTFRRLVLTTDAQITNRLRVHTETEMERLFGIEVEKSATATAGGLRLKQGVEGNNGGELALEQAWGQYNFAENHGLRVGIVLPPLGRFNILHDDDYWELPRRTLVDRDGPIVPVKAAWRDLGAGLVGSFGLGRTAKLDYQVYVLNGATLDFNLEAVAQTRQPQRNKLELEGEFGLTSGIFDGSQSARAVAWRAALSPSLAGEFALSGYHGNYAPQWLGIHEPVNSLGFDYKWRRGALELEGEAVYTTLGRTRRVMEAFARTAYRSAAETSGAEARELESEVEFELGSLARTRYGFWTDVKYHWRPAWLKRSFLGRPFEDPRLVPILRYERVWLNRNLQELAFRNGLITGLQTDDLEQERISLGMSYRPVRSFGLQFAFEHNRRVNGGTLIFPRVPVGATNGLVTGMVFAF